VRRYCDGKVPAPHRDALRVECDVRGKNVTVFECRPPWQPTLGAEWTRQPVAQLRYDPDGHGTSTTWWSRRDGSMCSWGRSTTTPRVSSGANRFLGRVHGSGGEDSDTDVLVVSEAVDAAEPAAELAGRIERWTGNSTHVVTVGSKELRRMRRAREPILAAWEQDLVIVGGREALKAAG
jgi:hypothetical protein